MSDPRYGHSVEGDSGRVEETENEFNITSDRLPRYIATALDSGASSGTLNEFDLPPQENTRHADGRAEFPLGDDGKNS